MEPTPYSIQVGEADTLSILMLGFKLSFLIKLSVRAGSEPSLSNAVKLGGDLLDTLNSPLLAFQ